MRRFLLGALACALAHALRPATLRMEVQRVGEIALRVRDPSRSAAFYESCLGLAPLASSSGGATQLAYAEPAAPDAEPGAAVAPPDVFSS